MSSANDMMDEVCHLYATSIPDVDLTAPLRDMVNLISGEVNVKVVRDVTNIHRKYIRKIGYILQRSHATSCNNFRYFNLDHHIEDEFNNIIQSIPVDTFNSHHYSADVLVAMGWAVLLVYQYDCEKYLVWLSSIFRKLFKLKSNKHSIHFFNKLWEIKDKTLLPLSIFEDVVMGSPLYIEKLVIELIFSLKSVPAETCRSFIADVLFKRDRVEFWLKLCSKSPKVFQVSVNIIHMLVLGSRGEQKVITFLHEFHSSVLRISEQGIVHLYPDHLQSLVMRLGIRPCNFLASESSGKVLLEQLMNGLVSDRSVYLCLLSHFPRWIPYLFQYGIAIGEARGISRKLFTVDFQSA